MVMIDVWQELACIIGKRLNGFANQQRQGPHLHLFQAFLGYQVPCSGPTDIRTM